MRSSLCRPAVAAVLVTGFFVNVDLRLRPDGSGKMLLTYPAHQLMSRDTESQRFASRVSSLTGFTVTHRLAHARVWFSDVNGLSEAPELQNTELAYERDGSGGGVFWATLRGAQIFDIRSVADATVVVTFPGPVVEANATAVSDAKARWQAPVKQYFSSTGIPMVARFGAGPTLASVAAP